MSNDNGIVRAFKLWAKISMMIVDGTRDATVVADILQSILDKSSLLEFFSTVVIPATTEQFVAKEKLVLNTNRNAKVAISYLSADFREWFLKGGGKTEGPICEQSIRYAKLRKNSEDTSIIAELGGEKIAEMTLTEMFSLLERQGTDECGVLLNNEDANIFYIKDQNAVLRTVFVRSDPDGWSVGVDSFDRMGRAAGSVQVFSRNPVL